MDWDITIANPRVSTAFGAYHAFVMNVATHYAGSRLLEQLDLAKLGSDSQLALSNNFSAGYTTIRTVGELERCVRSGDYGQLALRLATIQLCTAFEAFFDDVCDIYGVTILKSEPAVLASYRVASVVPFELGNKTIKQIRKLHVALGVNSRLNDDEVLVRLSAIIEVRNCIIHCLGKVTDKRSIERLKAYALRYNLGDSIELHDNHLDDFLHYMAIHVGLFVKCAP